MQQLVVPSEGQPEGDAEALGRCDGERTQEGADANVDEDVPCPVSRGHVANEV